MILPQKEFLGLQLSFCRPARCARRDRACLPAMTAYVAQYSGHSTRFAGFHFIFQSTKDSINLTQLFLADYWSGIATWLAPNATKAKAN